MLSKDKKESLRRSRAQGESLGWFLVWSGLIGPLFYVHPLLFVLGMGVLIFFMGRHVDSPQKSVYQRLRDSKARGSVQRNSR